MSKDDDQTWGKLFYSREEYNNARTANYWGGVMVGGFCVLVVALLAGLFIV